MSSIVSIHSFRGGTGKSNITANLAVLLAARGHRVGIVDTDIQSPGIHVLFGMDPEDTTGTLNDFLWGKCEIEQAARNVTPLLRTAVRGQLYLIPSSVKAGDIARVLHYGYDVGLLRDGFMRLVKTLPLDVLLIDTHPGLNEETLLSIALSDVLLILLRPDQQDYQGTAVTVDVSRHLEVPRMYLLVNKMPPSYDPIPLEAKVREAYGCDVAAVIPHSDDVMILASSGIFVLQYPNHPVTTSLRRVATLLGG